MKKNNKIKLSNNAEKLMMLLRISKIQKCGNKIC